MFFELSGIIDAPCDEATDVSEDPKVFVIEAPYTLMVEINGSDDSAVYFHRGNDGSSWNKPRSGCRLQHQVRRVIVPYKANTGFDGCECRTGLSVDASCIEEVSIHATHAHGAGNAARAQKDCASVCLKQDTNAFCNHVGRFANIPNRREYLGNFKDCGVFKGCPVNGGSDFR